MRRFLSLLAVCALSSLLFSSASAFGSEAESPQKVYSKALMAHLKNGWNYQVTPEYFQDTVTVKLKIDREGKLTEAAILKNAAHKSLDDEALKQLSEMQPFPKMPAEMSEEIAFAQFPYNFSPTSIKVNLRDKDKYLQSIDTEPEPTQQ
jgi:TonB family protein